MMKWCASKVSWRWSPSGLDRNDAPNAVIRQSCTDPRDGIATTLTIKMHGIVYRYISVCAGHHFHDMVRSISMRVFLVSA